jgi:hypothetical protein
MVGDQTAVIATGVVMARLVRSGAVDPVLATLHPYVVEPASDAPAGLWRQSWVAGQDVRGLGSDLISPPNHYRPNPYWAPNQIRLWAYNRAALLLVEQQDKLSKEVNTLLRYLGVE